jgi:hypothetical protein
MIQTFLKAKHWQLFLLTFGIPLILQLIFLFSILLNIPTDFTRLYFNFLPFLLLLLTAILFGWFWSIVFGLKSKLPSMMKIKLTNFKIFYFTPLIYILFITGWLNIVLSGGDVNPLYLAFIIPLHLFSMFCIIYTLYYVAKIFKSVELQREVSFSDFIGEFFLIWFFPIGIWFIQPRINKIMYPK